MGAIKLWSFTLSVVPELRSTTCHESLLSQVALVCRYTLSCLWHDLSKSSEPTHEHLRTTHKQYINIYLKQT